MKTAFEQAADVLSKNYPVYKRVSVASEGVEAEIFISEFGYVAFVSGTEEIRIRPCAAATAKRLVEITSVLAPFGNIIVPER